MEAQSFKELISHNMEFIEWYMDERVLHEREIEKRLNKRKLQAQVRKVNKVKALNASSVLKESINSMNESSLNSEIRDMHALTERYMIHFRLLHSHLKVLSNTTLVETRTKNGLKRAFTSLFGQDVKIFMSTMFLNMDQLEKQLDKEEFHENLSMAAFRAIAKKALHKREYGIMVNERQIQTQEGNVNMSKAWDTGLVVTKSNGTESGKQDESSPSGNDTDTDDADIRPSYDIEPMVKDDCNINPDSSDMNHKSIFKIRETLSILKEKGTKVKHEIDEIEIINIELEHSVAKLLKENKHVKAWIQEKVFANATLQNEIRKLTGKNVDPNFRKASILGKPPVQQIRNQPFMRQSTAFKSERPQFLKSRLFKAWQLSNHPKNPSISSKHDRAYICTISGAIRGTTTISPILTKSNNLKTTHFSGMTNGREMTPPLDLSTPPQIPNNTTSKRPLITTTVFAATTPENTPFAYHASTSTNPNPTISPAFDYDEEREMEPRPEPHREATPVLRLREGNRKEKNAEGIRPSETEAREVENRRANLSPLLAAHLGRNENSTLLSHHAQPFLPSNLNIPTGLVPIHVNPYSQPSANLIHGQAPNFPFQTQVGDPSAGGTFTYHPQGGYIPQAFTNSSVPSYNGPMHPTVTPASSYPFYTQPVYAPPTMPAYLNPVGPFADSAGSVTPFVRWIEDYPLSDGLKMPSHIDSYDGKGDPDNFLHLFEGAILMQKWLMPVACHMFTYTIKDSARIWWNSQKIGSIINYEDLKAKFRSHFSFVHGLRTRSLVEHLSTDLPSTYKGLMEKTYTWAEAKERTEKAVEKSEGNSSHREGCKKLRATSKDVRKYLRIQIQEVVNSGQLSHLVKGIKKERTKSSDTTQGGK
ncbi:hypothetical protein Tco_0615894 [Tanacetum coccineum]